MGFKVFFIRWQAICNFALFWCLLILFIWKAMIKDQTGFVMPQGLSVWYGAIKTKLWNVCLCLY